jgi:hypothetical protein
MANKSIIKSASAIANNTLYTHTDSIPLLISTSNFKVSIPSSATYSTDFGVYCTLYLAKKQVDGTYINIKLDNTMFAGWIYYGGGSHTDPTRYTIIGYNQSGYYATTGDYSAYSTVIPNSYNSVPSGYSISDYAVGKGKLVISSGDYIYCTIAGTNTGGLVIFTAIITATTLPQNRTYKATLFKGYWSSGSNYQKNDTVINNSHLYMAIQNNSASTITTDNWVLIKNNAAVMKALTLSDLTTTSGKLSPLVKETLNVSSTLSNKLFIDVRATDNFGPASTSTSISIPTISTNVTLALATNTQTLRYKSFSNNGFSNNTWTSSNTFNFSGQTVDFNYGSSTKFNDNYMLLKPVTKTLITGTNNILLNSTGGITFVCQTTTTAADSFSIVLPSASSYAGYFIIFFIKMLAANQTVSFSTVKTSRNFTASTTANLTDKYQLVCDGTNWYCIQVNKGIS